MANSQNHQSLERIFRLNRVLPEVCQKIWEIKVPLTTVLREDAFGWNERAGEAFNRLKETMSAPLVLGLPSFSKPFIIESDASGEEIGAMVIQNGRPLAYLS